MCYTLILFNRDFFFLIVSRQFKHALLELANQQLSSCRSPPEKLLGDGLSTPVTLFCLICTIISNKTGILD